MNRSRFEPFVRRAGYTLVGRRATQHGDVFMAEKFVPYDPAVVENGIVIPHWKVLWAFDRGTMDAYEWWVARAASSRAQRIKATINRAKQFVADNLETGRYA